MLNRVCFLGDPTWNNCEQLTEEEKVRSGPQMGRCNTPGPARSYSCQTTASFRGGPQRLWWRKFLQCSKLSAVQFIVYHAWRGWWFDLWIYIDPCVRRNNNQRSERRKFGKVARARRWYNRSGLRVCKYSCLTLMPSEEHPPQKRHLITNWTKFL